MGTVVVFRINDLSLALDVENVQRVIWAVEITPVPGQSFKLLGVINVEDRVIPVLNMRNILGMPDKELELEDHILIFESGTGSGAFVVDSVERVLHFNDDQRAQVDADADSISSGLLKVDGELLTVVSPEALMSHCQQNVGNRRALSGSRA